ncbi:MORC family CW-type zinc finger protein 3-like [Notolabrus celidotus]|uniref:MORC family CW-type zinc finger protein 3-like n=1 Tax=Notolabrus celidotus TaxID=1203425 RepID=UPI00149057F6|nr:MORC family CW-type zinc finger protein 3-like [Notolabrus celidotus]
MTAPTGNGVPISTLSPKYLHSNSTSHAGPFSAIAELIDNAYDPDVCARQIWIDVPFLRGQQILSFMDNGNGLDFKTMHKMLSFGYSDKSPVKGRKPIGMYGNGFKSGAMRLGRDAIVFSKSKSTSCVGMLSQTYLEDTQAEHIAVPIVCFEGSEPNLSIREDQRVSLEAILKYSPFRTEEELFTEIRAITSPGTNTKTGTRIIIWNLRRTSVGSTELDFQTERYDIQFPSDFPESTDDSIQQAGRVASHIPKSSYSLRAYCSLLYLKPRMQILLRGTKVDSRLIAKSLAYTKKDFYKPAFLNKKISITFGYNTESKHQYGFMMYHKNRLIKAYERVGCQLKTNYQGVGVIGIIECGEFLEPTHNKQSFNETDKYRRTMINLGIKLDDYWKEMSHRRQEKHPSDTTPVEDTVKLPDQTWVRCEDCLKWRKVPDGFKTKASDKWTCSLNPDPEFRDCDVEEELEDSEDEQSGYKKTYKQSKKPNQKKQREQKQKEQVRLVVVAKEKEDPKLQLEEMTPSKASPSHTNTGRNRSESPQEGAATASPYQLRSSIPQVDCSSPRSSWESVDVSPPPKG